MESLKSIVMNQKKKAKKQPRKGALRELMGKGKCK